MFQRDIKNNFFVKIGCIPVLEPMKLQLLNSPTLKNLTQNLPSEEKTVNDLKFLSNKRGRKKKALDTKDENTDESSDKNDKEGKVHNKYCNDNVKRRLKAFYHKYIISLLNNLMKTLLNQTSIKFVKMNSKITKDITIEYNRALLNKKIKDIIVDISNKYVDRDNNKKCLQFIEKKEDNEEIVKILNMTYEELYTDYYLKSNKNDTKENSFEEHKEILLKKCGQIYLDKYIENSEKLIDFFTSGKNRKSRKKLISEVFEIHLDNDSKISGLNNEVTHSDDVENYFIKKNMVSTCSQTDIYDINTKLISFA